MTDTDDERTARQAARRRLLLGLRLSAAGHPGHCGRAAIAIAFRSPGRLPRR